MNDDCPRCIEDVARQLKVIVRQARIENSCFQLDVADYREIIMPAFDELTRRVSELEAERDAAADAVEVLRDVPGSITGAAAARSFYSEDGDLEGDEQGGWLNRRRAAIDQYDEVLAKLKQWSDDPEKGEGA